MGKLTNKTRNTSASLPLCTACCVLLCYSDTAGTAAQQLCEMIDEKRCPKKKQNSRNGKTRRFYTNGPTKLDNGCTSPSMQYSWITSYLQCLACHAEPNAACIEQFNLRAPLIHGLNRIIKIAASCHVRSTTHHNATQRCLSQLCVANWNGCVNLRGLQGHTILTPLWRCIFFLARVLLVTRVPFALLLWHH